MSRHLGGPCIPNSHPTWSITLKLRRRNSHNEQGVVLVMVLLFTTLLTYLSLSSFSSTESNVAIQRQENDSLQAELAAQSGIEFAKFQLMENSSWAGTDDWVEFDNSQFMVTVSDTENFGLLVSVEGRSGDGKRVLEMEYEFEGGGGDMDDVGCYLLSSYVDMEKCHFNSDVFLADQAGSVYDYKLDVFGNETWTLNTSYQGPTEISNTKINHTSYQFSDNDYYKGCYDKVVLDSPVYMPAWNLDYYLEPNPDILVLYGVEELSEENFSQTVVVVLDEGDTLNVNDCNIHGGLVVYLDPDYDLRSGPRNVISIEKSNIGTGAAPHIGLIAPGCEVKAGGTNNNVHGLCFWNEIDDIDKMHVNGALIVVNQVDDLDNFNFHAHPPTLADFPEGVTMKTSEAEITLITGGEALP